MFLLLPIGTDNRIRRRPWVNYALIAINIVVFMLPSMLPMLGVGSSAAIKKQIQAYLLYPTHPQLYQFISYAFLHAGVMHIFGNMFFLYIFGNNVNDKLGNLGYLMLYLGGGVFSGIGHTLFNQIPILGASGAVAAVTGAYMVLYPKTRIHTLYWIIYFIGTTEFSAVYFILFKLIIYDNVIEPNLNADLSHVAHGAHLAGYLYGIAVPLAMLALKLLPHSQFDLWALVKRWRRRQEYRSMVNRQYDAFTGQAPGRKTVFAKVTDSEQPDPNTEQIAQLRADIANSLYGSNLGEAAETYLELIKLDDQQVLPQQQQLDIANKLMHSEQHEPAAKAYEDFIRQYPRYPFIEQVQLMLGLLYSRYLDQKDLARKHLQGSLEKLSDPNQKQMCQNELANL